MKYNRLIVILENKSGGMYQVDLPVPQQDLVKEFISQLHGGAIRVFGPKLPLKITKKRVSDGRGADG